MGVARRSKPKLKHNSNTIINTTHITEKLLEERGKKNKDKKKKNEDGGDEQGETFTSKMFKH